MLTVADRGGVKFAKILLTSYVACSRARFCMQDTFARATHSAKRARDDSVSCIQRALAR